MNSVFVAPLQKDIVESILAELQQCVADPAYEWHAQQPR